MAKRGHGEGTIVKHKKTGKWMARASLKVVQELLGHARIATTADIYSHVSAEVKRSAIAKLNGILRVKK